MCGNNCKAWCDVYRKCRGYCKGDPQDRILDRDRDLAQTYRRAYAPANEEAARTVMLALHSTTRTATYNALQEAVPGVWNAPPWEAKYECAQFWRRHCESGFSEVAMCIALPQHARSSSHNQDVIAIAKIAESGNPTISTVSTVATTSTSASARRVSAPVATTFGTLGRRRFEVEGDRGWFPMGEETNAGIVQSLASQQRTLSTGGNRQIDTVAWTQTRTDTGRVRRVREIANPTTGPALLGQRGVLATAPADAVYFAAPQPQSSFAVPNPDGTPSYDEFTTMFSCNSNFNPDAAQSARGPARVNSVSHV